MDFNFGFYLKFLSLLGLLDGGQRRGKELGADILWEDLHMSNGRSYFGNINRS